MSIERMKKLRVIALREQRDELMTELMRLGCVQVRKQPEILSDPEAAAALAPERADLPRRRTELNHMQSALKILERYAPEKKKLLSARPEVSESRFLDDEGLNAGMQLAEDICAWEAQVRRLAADESRVRTEIESLRPWDALELPLNSAGTRRCAVALASAVAEMDMQSVRTAAESASEAVEILSVSDDDQQHCFAVIALKEELDAVMDAIRAIGCTQVTFPGLTGLASDNIRRLQEELGGLEAQRKELEDRITAQGPSAGELRLAADRAAAEVSRAENIERLYGTGTVIALEGWCPAEDESAAEALLERFDCAYEFTDPAQEEYPEVPVKLKNPKAVEPMNLVTEMYSLPAYDGVDPNPYMWPFFILFYGIMMADMGYGILMILASIIAVKKMKPKGGTGYLLKLLGMSGVSTFIFGALTGGFFGDMIPQIASIINPDTTLKSLPSLFTPLTHTTMILVGSLALGVVQIFTGMIINVVHKCKNGERLSALFEEGAWWCILIGAVLLILKVTPILLILGGVLLVVGQFYEKKSLMGGLTGLFGAIYNGVTGYFSDILSYSRLMALMLAGSVIAMVFNTLGAMTGNVIAFIIIAMIGNGLNFALNLLGCFVHDLRLQVLEFFNRFYKDGGKPFKPLNIDPQYVDIIKEEI